MSIVMVILVLALLLPYINGFVITSKEINRLDDEMDDSDETPVYRRMSND